MINWKSIHDGHSVFQGVDLDALESLAGYNLGEAVKHAFPINAVPEDVVKLLENTTEAWEDAMYRQPHHPHRVLEY